MLDALAQGLRSAGGILSPGVSKQLDDERELAMRQEQAKKSMIAQRIIAGVEQGAINPELGRTQLAQLGFGDFPQGALGPTPEAQTRMQALVRQKQKEAFFAAPEVQAMVERGEDEKVARMLHGRGLISYEELLKVLGETRKANEPKGFAPGSVIYQGGQQVGTVPREQFSEPYVNESGQRVQKGPDGRVHILSQAPEEWSEPYDGPRGTKLQRNIRTGQIRQVVSQAPATIINPAPAPLVQIADATSPTGVRLVPRDQAIDKPAPRDNLNREDKVQDNFRQETKKFNDVILPSYQKALEYAQKIAKNSNAITAASDQALYKMWVKLDDPDDRISEGDMKRQRLLGSLGARAVNAIERLASGAVLPTEVRDQLLRDIEAKFSTYNDMQIRVEDHYLETLSRNGLNARTIRLTGIRPNQTEAQPPQQPARQPAGQRPGFTVLGPER